MVQWYKNSTWEVNPTAGGIGPTVGPNVTKCHCGKKFHRSLALFIRRAGAARLALPPQQPRYLGEFAETVKTPAISLELPISAATLWAAAPTRFPSAVAIPAHSTIQCPPLRHPTSPSAHPARAGVRSESPSLSAASLRRLSPPPLSTASLRRRSPPPLSAAVFCRRSPPPLFTASLRLRSPPSLCH